MNTIICPHCQCKTVRLTNPDTLSVNPYGETGENRYLLDTEAASEAICDTCFSKINIQGSIVWQQPEIKTSSYTIKCPYCDSTKVRMHNPSCLCETAYPSSPYVFDHVADTQAICDDCGKHSSTSGEIVWKQPEKIN